MAQKTLGFARSRTRHTNTQRSTDGSNGCNAKFILLQSSKFQVITCRYVRRTPIARAERMWPSVLTTLRHIGLLSTIASIWLETINVKFAYRNLADVDFKWNGNFSSAATRKFVMFDGIRCWIFSSIVYACVWCLELCSYFVRWMSLHISNNAQILTAILRF